MFSNNTKCSNRNFRPKEFAYITKHGFMSHHTNMLSLFILWGWFMTKFILRGYLCFFITNILQGSVHTFCICLVPKHYIASQWPIQCISVDRVLYDKDLHHEIVKNCEKLKWRQGEFPASLFCFMYINFVNTFWNYSASLFWMEWNWFAVDCLKVLENWLHNKI